MIESTRTTVPRKRKMKYTIREAASIRGVHPDTVRRQIRAGKLKAKLEFVDLLKSSIYFIPKNELHKITAKPGGRPKKTCITG
jgi:hypothetical protein